VRQNQSTDLCTPDYAIVNYVCLPCAYHASVIKAAVDITRSLLKASAPKATDIDADESSPLSRRSGSMFAPKQYLSSFGGELQARIRTLKRHVC
jgi:hypothetical protein